MYLCVLVRVECTTAYAPAYIIRSRDDLHTQYKAVLFQFGFSITATVNSLTLQLLSYTVELFIDRASRQPVREVHSFCTQASFIRVTSLLCEMLKLYHFLIHLLTICTKTKIFTNSLKFFIPWAFNSPLHKPDWQQIL